MLVAVPAGMGGFLLVVCVVALGAAGGIVFLLHGPIAPRPLITVPRASLTTIAAPSAAQVASTSHPSPEAMFAAEQHLALVDAHRAAATISPLAPMPYPAHATAPESLPAPVPPLGRQRVTAPQPLPRSRAARGTDAPRAVVASVAPEDDTRDSFQDIDPTMIFDEGVAS
jgi:hypothetical protein